MVRPIVAPTVPRGLERVRVCVHAGNTADEIAGLCSTIEAWLVQELEEDERGVIKDETLTKPRL